MNDTLGSLKEMVPSLATEKKPSKALIYKKGLSSTLNGWQRKQNGNINNMEPNSGGISVIRRKSKQEPEAGKRGVAATIAEHEEGARRSIPKNEGDDTWFAFFPIFLIDIIILPASFF